MSDRNKVRDVASGSPYTVVLVNERAPAVLEDFVAVIVVTLTVADGQGDDDHLVEIRGAARLDGDSVIIYEKDGSGVGKDVRTWLVTGRDGRFEATERSMF